VFPDVYMDLSLTIPFAGLEGGRAMREALGLCPISKLLYATDATRYPEVFLVAATAHRDALAEAIAGRQLRGSWMANPEVFGIYKILGTVSRSAAVLSAPLVLGKETFLDASLAPAVARIAGDATRRSACSASLPPLAKRLLTDVEAHGEIRMDRWSASTPRSICGSSASRAACRSRRWRDSSGSCGPRSG